MKFLVVPTVGGVVSSSHQQSLRLLSAARVLLAVLIAIWIPLAEQGTFRLEFSDPEQFFTVSIIYLAMALTLWALNRTLKGAHQLQLVMSTLIDILILGILLYFAGGAKTSFAILLLAPVAAASVLATQKQALFLAAAASLVLLIEVSLRWLEGDTFDLGSFVQAGMIGGIAFLTAFLINRLALRLAEQERITAQRDDDLRTQFEINQRVIAELSEGVVILDESGAPRAMNGAAEKMLGGMGVVLPQLTAGAPSLLWHVPASGDRIEGKVQLRAVSTATSNQPVLVFVQDQLEVEQRAQNLKLAAMGRLSASIAHEIRNPLSAIRHANGLLSEMQPSMEGQASTMSRLTAMIESNTVRINRIVEDVLLLSKRGSGAMAAKDLPLQTPGLFVKEWLEEFALQNLKAKQCVTVLSQSPTTLRFEPNHLRQVLVNLVGNALRYSSGRPSSVMVLWRIKEQHGELLVVDDGPGLSDSQRQHLFEPFYSTEASGTGLGLFLARELCAANGAELIYTPFVDDSVTTAAQCFMIRSQFVE